MPLLQYFTIEQIQDFESNELQGWLEAVDINKEKDFIRLLSMLPYASTTFKNQLRNWQNEVANRKRSIEVSLGIYHAQKSKPMNDNERRNLFKGGKKVDRSKETNKKTKK